MRDEDDAFGRFVLDLPAHKRGRGHSQVNTNAAPSDVSELVPYFLSLTPGQLAGCWVACFVDAAVFGGFEPGPVARALVIVAERLHGVKFPEPIQGVPPVTAIPSSSPFSAKAQSLRERDARAAGTHADASPPAPPPVAPGTPIKVGDIEIFTGPPPAAKPKQMRAALGSVMAAAAALPVGGWFVWKDAKKTMNCTLNSKKFSAACGFEVLIYRTVPGTVVVKRPAPQGV